MFSYLVMGLFGGFATIGAVALVLVLLDVLGVNVRVFGKTSRSPAVHPISWHVFEACTSGRHLVLGPKVPENESWVLTSMCAKNNQDTKVASDRRTQEINVAIYDGHEWLCLESVHDAEQFECASWAGELVVGPGWQLGGWFRDAERGDVLQVDATAYVAYDLMT